MKCSLRILAGTVIAAAAVLDLAGCNEPKQAKDARPLPALGANVNETTVSGISSGAYMAGQFQMAHA